MNPKKFDIYAPLMADMERVQQALNLYLGPCEATGHCKEDCPVTPKGANDWKAVHYRMFLLQEAGIASASLVMEAYRQHGRNGFLPDSWYEENTRDSWIRDHNDMTILLNLGRIHLRNLSEGKFPEGTDATSYLAYLQKQILDEIGEALRIKRGLKKESQTEMASRGPLH